MRDLSSAESVMIDFFRGEAGSDFHATIATSGGRWHVILSSPSDPVLVGVGASFGEALSEAMGVDAEPGGGPGDGEAVPTARALRVVAGTDHQSERKVA